MPFPLGTIIFDTASTILHLRSPSTAYNMNGLVLKDYKADDFGKLHPLTYTQSYGKREKRALSLPPPLWIKRSRNVSRRWGISMSKGNISLFQV
jgi:hypothetical protein